MTRGSLLRLLTCGSVDDGKSTLLGRLLFDARVLHDDHLAALRRDDHDFSLLFDGLEDERSQGITIDVAYRFFRTARRSFVVADAPGHEQYTRNMATAASTADVAVLLVDAQRGLLVQTQRHSAIAALFGVRRVVLAVNKMDLVGYARDAFLGIARAFERFAAPLGFGSIVAIPVSARHGDNVVTASTRMPWYDGPTLLAYLESVDVESEPERRPLRMPVQWVNRFPDGTRGYAGTLSSGRIAPGAPVRLALSSERTTTVERIVTFDGDLTEAVAGQAVTLVLADALDVSRGDVIADPVAPPTVSDELTADLLWMADEELIPGRKYWLKLAARSVLAEVTTLEHRLDLATALPGHAPRTLHAQEIARARLRLGEPVACDAYANDHDMGGFLLIDRTTNDTVGAGTVVRATPHGALRPYAFDIDQSVRARMKGQRPRTVWLTGLPAAGKSTLANLIERELVARGRHTYVLDGDSVRRGLTRDLGFSEADRVENVRRVAEAARLLVDAGLIVIVALISPFRADRRAAREVHGPGEFVEVFVDTPLEVCMARDPKGLYARAKANQLQGFTGLSAPYEPPEAPDLVLRTTEHDAATLAERVVAFLERA